MPTQDGTQNDPMHTKPHELRSHKELLSFGPHFSGWAIWFELHIPIVAKSTAHPYHPATPNHLHMLSSRFYRPADLGREIGLSYDCVAEAH